MPRSLEGYTLFFPLFPVIELSGKWIWRWRYLHSEAVATGAANVITGSNMAKPEQCVSCTQKELGPKEFVCVGVGEGLIEYVCVCVQVCAREN